MVLKKIGTKAVHAGHLPNIYGAHTTPLYQTSTFVFDTPEQGGRRFAGKESGFVYTRIGNPTVRACEEAIAQLEGAQDGVAFASGMGATACAVMALAKNGDHIVATDTLYGGTDVLFSQHLPDFGISVSLVDSTDLEKVRKAIRKNTKCIWIETPANPTLKITDLKGIVKIGKKHKIPVIADSTFSSPIITRPIEFGCDAVMHSATKYLGGHGDLVAGIVVGSKKYIAEVKDMMSHLGPCLAPLEAWLILRGLKTLHLRMPRHSENACTLAYYLKGRKEIKKVYYPGFEDFPGHDIAKKQMKGFGGIIAFEMNGGFSKAKKLLKSLKLASIAVSLGTIDTLIQHPASMTHAGVPKKSRIAKGITDTLIRISVGVEDITDIIEDFKQALNRL
ncbi:trans-sulfuration enzyme family protein [Planctomycetota bacterium]